MLGTVSFRNQKATACRLVSVLAAGFYMLWSLQQDNFIWFRMPCSTGYSVPSFILKCYIKLGVLRRRLQHSPMLIKFRGLTKKEAPFIRVQGNPQENIIILTIVIVNETPYFRNLYQRAVGSHLALSDFQV